MTRTSNKFIDREAFAIRLKALRKESGMTQDQLAKKVGSTRSCVGNWENGSRFPESKFVDAMARIYSVPIDYMYGASEHRYNIKVPDYFELDSEKLNHNGLAALYDYYKLLLNSDIHTNKGL